MAASPSSLLAISTKPKPRERPASRSSTTLADSTVPACANSCSKSWLEVENDKFPTYSFIDIDTDPFPFQENKEATNRICFGETVVRRRTRWSDALKSGF